LDYAATTHVEPYPGVVPYRLPGMSYTNATPAFMKQHGFETYVFHGNSALFYERGAVFDDLGFDHMFFKEELAPLHLPTSLIGVRDADVLRCMLKAIQPGKRSYLFGITLDSHTPFQQLLPSEMEIFPHPENTAQRYLNAIRHVDNCLRTFIGQLPKGTTVVLYGDHTAGIHSDEFNSDDAQGRERVGCLIYQVGGDLGAQQKTRNAPIATDGSLNLLDVMSYLRQSVAANAGSAPLSPTGKPR
jgi:phosphoglycerol transferase MdoB-like AlkP superfamily enzyme